MSFQHEISNVFPIILPIIDEHKSSTSASLAVVILLKENLCDTAQANIFTQFYIWTKIVLTK